MARKSPVSTQYVRLLEKNAHSCCVCKRTDIGFNLHHIDADNSNTIDDNLAVLCVEQHDVHHRQGKYPNHIELSAERLTAYKKQWENFVAECRKPHPNTIATLNVFGNSDCITGMKLIFQNSDGEIVFERIYHSIEAPMDKWIDKAIFEVSRFGKNIKFALIDHPIEPEYCNMCQSGISETLDPNSIFALTTPDWSQKSIGTVYVYPDIPRLSFTVFYDHSKVFDASIHKCNGLLHIIYGNKEEFIQFDEAVTKTAQVDAIVTSILQSWNVGRVFIGTGDDNAPTFIEKIVLTDLWDA